MEEINLVERAKIGDEEALQRIYEQYFALISFKVNRFHLAYSEREDFIQEGRIGLFKAIKLYDRHKGAGFPTFASICIEGQLITAFNKSNNLKSKMIKTAIMNHHELSNEQKIDGTIYSNSADPESLLLGKEKLTDLKKCFKNNLSKLEAEILDEMLLGLTYLEIAEKIGKRPKTVDNAMQRIKRKMKKCLED